MQPNNELRMEYNEEKDGLWRGGTRSCFFLAIRLRLCSLRASLDNLGAELLAADWDGAESSSGSRGRFNGEDGEGAERSCISASPPSSAVPLFPSPPSVAVAEGGGGSIKRDQSVSEWAYE